MNKVSEIIVLATSHVRQVLIIVIFLKIVYKLEII